MTMDLKTTAKRKAASQAQAGLVDNCSFEMTARDRAALDAATGSIHPGAELFVANMTRDAPGVLVEASIRVRRAGFVPVPHIVARNIAGPSDLDGLVGRLSGEAGVDRVLLLGGDRERPAGPFTSALELLQSGALQKHGIGRVALACYPERHPRIPDDVLWAALAEKLSVARRDGIEATLISQFAFEAGPIVAMTRRLRQSGATVPLRVGLAGPVSHAKLLRYALRCGIGPSLRILRDRKDLAFGMLAGETPDALVADLSAALALDASLAIGGIHLFTFGALAGAAEWARAKQRA